jgi:hypothetical protein
MNKIIVQAKQVATRAARPLLSSISDDPASGLPGEIMWMPPGFHVIRPLVNGQPKEIQINVDASLAARFASQLESLRAAAAAGRGDFPFLDFNHNGSEASAEVTGLRWAGADPKSGGIRAKVKWTTAGADAVRGRMYRRFSPQWSLEPHTLKPDQISANMGGLVNSAAFNSISAVARATGIESVSKLPVQRHEIFRKAAEVATADRLSDADALKKVINENPALFADYVTKLGGDASVVAKCSGLDISGDLTDLAFLLGSAVFAVAKGISDPMAAQTAFGATAQGRQAYDIYRQG